MKQSQVQVQRIRAHCSRTKHFNQRRQFISILFGCLLCLCYHSMVICIHQKTRNKKPKASRNPRSIQWMRKQNAVRKYWACRCARARRSCAHCTTMKNVLICRFHASINVVHFSLLLLRSHRLCTSAVPVTCLRSQSVFFVLLF